jgi:hypothetical protein
MEERDNKTVAMEKLKDRDMRDSWRDNEAYREIKKTDV